jgi:hypothetical protein
MAYLKRLTFLIGENEDVLVFGGHFTVAGSTIDFGDLGTGTVSGNTLTVTEDSEVWVYRR